MRKTLILASGLLSALLLSGQSVADVIDLARAQEYTAASQKSIPTLFGIRLKPLTKAVKPATKYAAPVVAQTSVQSAQTKQKPALLAVVDKPDIKEKHRIIADEVLRSIPSGCRDNLNNFYVRYSKPDRRGLGGKTTIILDGTVPDDEFRALLVHECGHVIHSNLMGEQRTGPSGFMDGKAAVFKDAPVLSFFQISWDNESVFSKGTTKRDFVSGYASSDPFEDFAESFAFFILHRGAFEAQAEDNIAIDAKLRWMEQHLTVGKMAAKSDYKWTGSIPWDITKLAFSWKG